MKRRPWLVTRIILTTALFALCGVLLAGAATSLIMARYVVSNAQRIETPAVRRALRACEAGRPPRRPIRVGPLQAALFDANTLEPRTRGAELNPKLVRRITESGRRQAVMLGWPLGKGTQALLRRSKESPCGLVQVTMTAVPLFRGDFRGAILVLMGMAVVGASLGAYLFAARPLLRRVAAASQAAGDVGKADFALTRFDDWEDLSVIARSLVRADQRIKADAHLLEQRASELEGLMGAVAHDLKTPLATMQLNLQRAASAAPGPDRDDAFARTLGEIQYVAALMENMETAARIRGGLMETASMPVDLRAMVERTATRFKVLGAHRGIGVEAGWPDDPVTIEGDPILVERILTNLVHNAIRHGRLGGNVALLLGCSPTRFDLTIQDDGPGFPPSVLRSLGDDPDSDFLAGRAGSNGLGLPIVRQLCARLGFDIAFDNPPDGGARIRVSGPLQGAM